MSAFIPEAATRMQGVGVPASLAIMSRVRELRQQGVKVINFNTRGDTPRAAKQAAIAMLETTAAAGYTDIRGTPALREAIARKLRRDNAIVADPASEILVTTGGMAGIFSTLLALVDRGDEVVLTDPGWLGFEPMLRVAGATPVRVKLIRGAEFALDLDVLRRAITRRSKVLLLCNPDNPTGMMFSAAQLEAIAGIVRDNDLFVVMDEAYENYVYDGGRHLSLAALPGMKRRTITIQTVSKIYNMFGWRVGWLVADADVAKPILAVHSCAVSCPTSFAQAGAAAALDGALAEGDVPIATLVRNYQAQREAMVGALRRIPGVRCASPQGAYFLFPDFTALGVGSVALSTHLLETGHVATTPGAAFGPAGEGHLRLVFNAPIDEIEEGVARIATALATLGR
jgi:aspartate aminotransferase